jgi:hypothetical protein
MTTALGNRAAIQGSAGTISFQARLPARLGSPSLACVLAWVFLGRAKPSTRSLHLRRSVRLAMDGDDVGPEGRETPKAVPKRASGRGMTPADRVDIWKYAATILRALQRASPVNDNEPPPRN